MMAMHEAGRITGGRRWVAAVALSLLVAVAPPHPARAGALDLMGTTTMVAIGGIAISMFVLTTQTVNCHGKQHYATSCIGNLRLGLSKHLITGPTIVLAVISQMISKGQTTREIGRAVARDVGLNPDRLRIQSRNHMQPPGNCTPQEHRDLEAAKDRECTIRRTCNGATDPITAALNVAQINVCIRARETIMQRCFMGGDDTHHRVLANERRALQRCEARMIGG